MEFFTAGNVASELAKNRKKESNRFEEIITAACLRAFQSPGGYLEIDRTTEIFGHDNVCCEPSSLLRRVKCMIRSDLDWKVSANNLHLGQTLASSQASILLTR